MFIPIKWEFQLGRVQELIARAEEKDRIADRMCEGRRRGRRRGCPNPTIHNSADREKDSLSNVSWCMECGKNASAGNDRRRIPHSSRDQRQ